jgi:chemotaxis protein histidine kinase CheA
MSASLFFEYFFEESRELLDQIGRSATGLRGIDIPDVHQEAEFTQCVQKLHRLIGGMASIGFEMYASVSHKTSLLAQRSSSSTGYPIAQAVEAILTIVTDFNQYFTSINKVKDIEMLVPRIEKKIDSCMAGFDLNKTTINSQSEIDDIMKMFGQV